jgi:methylthioribose-1-phosphate isomerase
MRGSRPGESGRAAGKIQRYNGRVKFVGDSAMSVEQCTQQVNVRPIFVEDGKLMLLDQTRIPEAVAYVDATGVEEMFLAIKNMVVRGAPAIGVAAALSLAFEAKRIILESAGYAQFRQKLNESRIRLQSARPTAVNLRWATDHIFEIAEENSQMPLSELAQLLLASAQALIEKDILINKAIGSHGAHLLKEECAVLTHCNAGALATCGWGTALGVIRSAVERGYKLTVFVDETRPRLQGARLTVWELLRDGITPVLITDNMAGYLMSQGKVDAVIVGADRIAANGDAANKIGTYSLAVLASHHGLPFYVAAPISTIDPQINSGVEIPIEERDADEVLCVGGRQIAAAGARVYNPAFDVTPARLISGIVTEKGVLYSPYEKSIAKALQD